jgi:hypothetical protein
MFAWSYLYGFYFLLLALVWIDSLFFCVYCSSFPISFLWHNFSNLLDNKLELSDLDNYGWVNIDILLRFESACGCYYFCLDDVLVSLSDGAPYFCSMFLPQGKPCSWKMHIVKLYSYCYHFCSKKKAALLKALLPSHLFNY